MKSLTEEKQDRIIRYYDQFAYVYDWISSKKYYQNSRAFAIKEMELKEGQTILNVPCGAGQNFDYFQEKLRNTGRVIGIDLSYGMLKKANTKIRKNKWKNITTIKENITRINPEWTDNHLEPNFQFDSILCDLGLSAIPDWQKTIDNLLGN